MTAVHPSACSCFAAPPPASVDPRALTAHPSSSMPSRRPPPKEPSQPRQRILICRKCKKEISRVLERLLGMERGWAPGGQGRCWGLQDRSPGLSRGCGVEGGGGSLRLCSLLTCTLGRKSLPSPALPCRVLHSRTQRLSLCPNICPPPSRCRCPPLSN